MPRPPAPGGRGPPPSRRAAPDSSSSGSDSSGSDSDDGGDSRRRGASNRGVAAERKYSRGGCAAGGRAPPGGRASPGRRGPPPSRRAALDDDDVGSSSGSEVSGSGSSGSDVGESRPAESADFSFTEPQQAAAGSFEASIEQSYQARPALRVSQLSDDDLSGSDLSDASSGSDSDDDGYANGARATKSGGGRGPPPGRRAPPPGGCSPPLGGRAPPPGRGPPPSRTAAPADDSDSDSGSSVYDSSGSDSDIAPVSRGAVAVSAPRTASGRDLPPGGRGPPPGRRGPPPAGPAKRRGPPPARDDRRQREQEELERQSAAQRELEWETQRRETMRREDSAVVIQSVVRAAAGQQEFARKRLAAVRMQSARRGQVARVQTARSKQQRVSAVTSLQGRYRTKLAMAVVAEKRSAKLRLLVKDSFRPDSDWLMYIEDNTPYYYNMKTGRSAWEMPSEGIVGRATDEGDSSESESDPQGIAIDKSSPWVAYFDTSAYRGGEPYFYNLKTAETVWELPDTCRGVAQIVRDVDISAPVLEPEPEPEPEPEAFEEAKEDAMLPKKKLRHPEDIRHILERHLRPESPWMIYRDEGGRLYFSNAETDESAWDLPGEGVGGCGDEPTEEFDEGPSPREIRRMEKKKEEGRRRKEEDRQAQLDAEGKRGSKENEAARKRRERQEVITRKVEEKQAESTAKKQAALILQSICRMKHVREDYAERCEKKRSVEAREAELRRRRLATEQVDQDRALREKREANREVEAMVRKFPWQEADEIEIYSKSKDSWERGRVTRVSGSVLSVNYGEGDSERMKKVDLDAEDILDIVRAPGDDAESLATLQRQRESGSSGGRSSVSAGSAPVDGGSNGARVDRVVFLEKRQVSPSIQGVQLRGMDKAVQPKTYYIYEVWWQGSRHEVEKRFSAFQKFDKKIRPLLTREQKSANALKKLPSTVNKEALWRTASVMDRREQFFQEYITDVITLAESGVNIKQLGGDQLGPNQRIGELLREFLGAPEGEIQMMRISLDEGAGADSPPLMVEEDSPEVLAAAARKEREKQLKKDEAAELERKQRAIARREMEEGDLPSQGSGRSRSGGGSSGSSSSSGGGGGGSRGGSGERMTKQEQAAMEAKAKRLARKEAKARANMPPPAGSPWQVHEHEGKRYWWNSETDASVWTCPYAENDMPR